MSRYIYSTQNNVGHIWIAQQVLAIYERERTLKESKTQLCKGVQSCGKTVPWGSEGL